MEYTTNQVPVDYSTMTKVEEIVETEPVVEERKSLLYHALPADQFYFGPKHQSQQIPIHGKHIGKGG